MFNDGPPDNFLNPAARVRQGSSHSLDARWRTHWAHACKGDKAGDSDKLKKHGHVERSFVSDKLKCTRLSKATALIGARVCQSATKSICCHPKGRRLTTHLKTHGFRGMAFRGPLFFHTWTVVDRKSWFRGPLVFHTCTVVDRKFL